MDKPACASYWSLPFLSPAHWVPRRRIAVDCFPSGSGYAARSIVAFRQSLRRKNLGNGETGLGIRSGRIGSGAAASPRPGPVGGPHATPIDGEFGPGSPSLLEGSSTAGLAVSSMSGAAMSSAAGEFRSSFRCIRLAAFSSCFSRRACSFCRFLNVVCDREAKGFTPSLFVPTGQLPSYHSRVPRGMLGSGQGAVPSAPSGLGSRH